MLEGPLCFPVRSGTSIVVVVRRVDVERVHSVNQPDLLIAESCAVDSERRHSDSPESDGVERSFHEDNHGSGLGRVVEEETPDINASWIEVLRASTYA